MKTREQVARFVEYQFSTYQGYDCSLPKGRQWHYGKQEVRELIDYAIQKVNDELQLNVTIKSASAFGYTYSSCH